jgi:hypothetical protein
MFKKKSKASKFGNCKCTYQGINFPSIFEKEVYRHLRHSLGTIFEIKTQYRIIVKPKTNKFQSISYIADFAIFLGDQLLCIVEAKGLMLEPFVLKMNLLEYHNPDIFSKIVLVISRLNDVKDYRKANLPVLKMNPYLSDNKFDSGFKRDFLNFFNITQLGE